MDRRELKKLSKDELIDLISATEKRFSSSNANAAELIAELDDTNTQLKSAYDELAQSSKLSNLGKVVSDICHDIANPLTITATNLHLLLRNSALTEQEIKKIETAIYGCGRIDRLISHLRKYIRKEDSREVSSHDLTTTVRETVDFFEEQLQEKGITVNFTPGEPIVISGNPMNLETALQNILINAKEAFEDCIKPPAEKQIDINLSVEGDSALLSIYDNAGGIPIDLQEKIFEPFYTSKGPDRGTGLGLSFVKRVIDELDGSVSLSVAEGVGSTFSFNLPMEGTTEKQQSTSRSTAQSPNEPLRLIIVDDEPSLIEIFRLYLEDHHHVEAYSDSRKALAEVRKKQYDILLTDLAMPGVDGVEILEAATDCTLKVVISGHVEMGDSRSVKAKSLADLVIAKPITDLNSLNQRLRDKFAEKLAQSGQLKKKAS